MNTKPENPPVHPRSRDALSEGKTLRDDFAGLAMQALLTNAFQEDVARRALGLDANEEEDIDSAAYRVAVAAYIYADAMLKERQKA